MVPSIIPRSLLAVLSLIGALQLPQVEAARGNCKDLNFKAGDIITTSPSEHRTYCGHTVGRYLALRDNVLFHLHCKADTASPTQAKVLILNLNDEATRSETFDSHQLCVAEPSGSGGPATGENAYNIAMKLSQAYVPYDTLACNAQHYIEYLAYGTASSKGIFAPKSICPVFKKFNRKTKTEGASFRLSGRNGMVYNWPNRNMKLTFMSPPPSPQSTPPRRVISFWDPSAKLDMSRKLSFRTMNGRSTAQSEGSSNNKKKKDGSSTGRNKLWLSKFLTSGLRSS